MMLHSVTQTRCNNDAPSLPGIGLETGNLRAIRGAGNEVAGGLFRQPVEFQSTGDRCRFNGCALVLVVLLVIQLGFEMGLIGGEGVGSAAARDSSASGIGRTIQHTNGRGRNSMSKAPKRPSQGRPDTAPNPLPLGAAPGSAILRAQALIFQPELTRSVWTDVMHRKRSRKSLEAMLRKEVRAGRYVGYRLLTIEAEYIGVCWPNDKLTDSRP